MSVHSLPGLSPCQSCGACCATYRVSFYWAEAAERGLPDALTQKLGPWMSCMAGTDGPAPRCQALAGKVGQWVGCGVYEQRPDACRELQPGEDKCNRARSRHGLAPLPAPAPQPTLPPLPEAA